jgi:hypothetical protein
MYTPHDQPQSLSGEALKMLPMKHGITSHDETPVVTDIP